jgi:hypothetical protein
MARLSALVAVVLVVAAVAPWSSAANEDCYKGCAKYEKTEPAQLARCKDECILEADFNEATQGLEACNRVCEETNKDSAANAGKCMETCTIKVDAAVGVAATRACYRDCARDSKDPAALKKCEASCDATGEKGAAATEKDMAEATAAAAPKRR